MKIIDYIDYIGVSEGTANHPHYKFILKHPPKDYVYRRGYLKEPDPNFDHQLNYFLENIQKKHDLNPSYRDFFKSRMTMNSSRIPDDVKLGMIPTICNFYTSKNYVVSLEDWTSIFAPYISNHITANLDKQSDFFAWQSAKLENDGCKYIFTHMKNIVDTMKKVWSKDFPQLVEKVKYLPLGIEEKKYIPKNKFKIYAYFNSYGAGSDMFSLRRGREVVEAFRRFSANRNDVKLIVFGQTPYNIADNVKIFNISKFLNEEEYETTMDKIDCVLIPGMRIHSISVIDSLARGKVVVCSDGWGFDEFITHENNGLISAGEDATFVDQDGIFRCDYMSKAHAPPNEKLINSILQNLNFIDQNQDAAKKISENSINYALTELKIESRNAILEECYSKIII